MNARTCSSDSKIYIRCVQYLLPIFPLKMHSLWENGEISNIFTIFFSSLWKQVWWTDSRSIIIFVGRVLTSELIPALTLSTPLEIYRNSHLTENGRNACSTPNRNVFVGILWTIQKSDWLELHCIRWSRLIAVTVALFNVLTLTNRRCRSRADRSPASLLVCAFCRLGILRWDFARVGRRTHCDRMQMIIAIFMI